MQFGRFTTLVTAAFGAVTTACWAAPDFSTTVYGCDDGICPAGYQCVDRACIREGDLPPGLDAAPPISLADASFDSDASTAADTPLPTMGFGEPVAIGELNSSADDDDPTLTDDMLEIYFNSNRPGGPGGGDIWMSTRESTAAPWQPPTPVDAINTSSSETTPEVSADGLTLWFGSNRAGGLGANDIWVSTRQSRADAWSAPVLVPELNSSSSDAGPTPDSTSLRMVFQSNRNGSWDLFETSRASTDDPWSSPKPLDELNTDAREVNGTLSDGGLQLIFDSDRSGGRGEHDIYVTRRSSLSAPFAGPQSVTELNTPQEDIDQWLSSDGRELIFESTRTGSQGQDLYRASR